jgi:hypothetical protein
MFAAVFIDWNRFFKRYYNICLLRMSALFPWLCELKL